MRTIMVVAIGLMLVAAMLFASGSLAVAGPHGPGGNHGGHHGGHHGHRGPHFGFGPGFIVGGSSYLVEDGCPTVKRCYVNQFGEKRCRWVSECD